MIQFCPRVVSFFDLSVPEIGNRCHGVRPYPPPPSSGKLPSPPGSWKGSPPTEVSSQKIPVEEPSYNCAGALLFWRGSLSEPTFIQALVQSQGMLCYCGRRDSGGCLVTISKAVSCRLVFVKNVTSGNCGFRKELTSGRLFFVYSEGWVAQRTLTEPASYFQIPCPDPTPLLFSSSSHPHPPPLLHPASMLSHPNQPHQHYTQIADGLSDSIPPLSSPPSPTPPPPSPPNPTNKSALEARMVPM